MIAAKFGLIIMPLALVSHTFLRSRLPQRALSRAATLKPTVHLQRNKSRIFADSFNPIVFDRAIDKVTGNPAAGDEVDVFDYSGALLGRGFYNSHSLFR
jgi:hypothetical protein